MYTITDVEELGGWIGAHFDGKQGGMGEGEEEEEEGGDFGSGKRGVEELWERVTEEELVKDPCVRVMREETEEGKKVDRNGGRKFVGVWRRREDPVWMGEGL